MPCQAIFIARAMLHLTEDVIIVYTLQKFLNVFWKYLIKIVLNKIVVFLH